MGPRGSPNVVHGEGWVTLVIFESKMIQTHGR